MVTCKRQGDMVAVVCDVDTASVLFHILHFIGGDPDTCKRKNMDDLRMALATMKLPWYDGHCSGSIDLAPRKSTRI